jgi:hypothetical protein
MKERRRQSRLKMRRALKRIPAVYEAGKLRGRGQVGGLSREGLFFCTDRLPDPGSPVRVVFSDHLGRKIEVSGDVRWNVNPPTPGFGMHIDRASERYPEFYENLLTS